MKGLAERLGMTPQVVRDWERDVHPPSETSIAKIAEVLGFPVEFFSGPDLDEPAADGASFRSLTAMTAGQRESALSAGAIAFLLGDYIEERFNLPEPDLLDLRDESPEVAANYLRQHWGIGERAIPNIVHLMESKGIRVFSLAEDCREVDAFSVWRRGKPYVFLNTLKSAEHSRYDAAHELCHLTMHRHGTPAGQQAEKQANEFASALLMPEGQVRSYSIIPNIKYLINLKKTWIVSLAALVVRLNRLGLISEWHYKRLAMEIQRRGYRVKEPEGARRETSKVWETVFTELRKSDKITKHDVAKSLAIPAKEIEALVFGLVLMGVSANPHARPTGRYSRPNLQLVT